MAEEKSIHIPNSSMDEAAGMLEQEYLLWKERFSQQPQMVQRFLEAQGRKLAEAMTGGASQVRFTLPDKVHLAKSDTSDAPVTPLPVPQNLREQTVGSWLDRILRNELGDSLHERLNEIELHPDPAVAAAGGLVRYAATFYMVHQMLPAGRSVTYASLDWEEIPTIPVADETTAGSAITASTDAIAEESAGEEGRGELIVPYVEAARRFYLPQWVAFGENDRLLVGSLQEAKAHLASMQRYVGVLHSAVTLAPYIIADPEYQQKRYGILGQLINQGRALARYEVREMIQTIQRRADANDLNRGLSLDLPYFEDQDLVRRTHYFDVIPAGRVMFVPAFVVLACRGEEVKVAQDTRLSPSTRKHLLDVLKMLEKAFDRTNRSS